MAQTAEVELVIKGKDQASSVMQKIGKAAKGIGIGVAAVGVAAVGMGVASVKNFANAGDEVQKMSLRTDWAVESLSELKHVADISGSSLNSFEKGTKKLSGAIVDAQAGLATYSDAFNAIGVDYMALKGMSPEEQFWVVAEALAAEEDATVKAAAALDLFGRTGTELFPMFEEGTQGIADLRQEAHDLGLVFSQEDANAAAEFNDGLTRLQGAFTGLMNEVAKALMPILLELIPVLVDLVKALPLKEIAELISTLLPPLVKLFIDLMAAIPFDKMLAFVLKVMEPLMKIFTAVVGLAAPLFKLLEPVLDILIMILDILSPIIDALAWVIDKIGGVLGGIGNVVGNVVGWIGGLFGGAEGAIVTRPTFGMIGEAGPEAVIPLDRAAGASALPGMGGGDVTNLYINVEGSVLSENKLIEAVRQGLNSLQNRNVTTGLV